MYFYGILMSVFYYKIDLNGDEFDMGKQTRVEKYKKLRQEIEEMDTNRFDNPYQVNDDFDSNDVAMNEEELLGEHLKKNTLSISIDQIVKAHEEYTTMLAQEDIEKQKKAVNRIRMRKLAVLMCAIGGLILLTVIIIILVIALAKQ